MVNVMSKSSVDSALISGVTPNFTIEKIFSGSVVLENTTIEGLGQRIEHSLIGRNVQLRRQERRSSSYRLILGDDKAPGAPAAEAPKAKEGEKPALPGDGKLQGWAIVEKNQSRIYDLVMDMLSYSKEREPALEAADINALVEDVLEVHDRVVIAKVGGELVKTPFSFLLLRAMASRAVRREKRLDLLVERPGRLGSE